MTSHRWMFLALSLLICSSSAQAQHSWCSPFLSGVLGTDDQLRREIDTEIRKVDQELRSTFKTFGSVSIDPALIVSEMRNRISPRYFSSKAERYLQYALCQEYMRADLTEQQRSDFIQALTVPFPTNRPLSTTSQNTAGKCSSVINRDGRLLTTCSMGLSVSKDGPIWNYIKADVRAVEFLFATSRSRSDTPDRVSFGYERSPSLALGAARVRVPDDHKIGQLELPANKTYLLQIVKEDKDPKRHFIIQGVASLTRDDWIDIARRRDEALIFVHGYNTTFDDALFRTAQIIWDLQYSGTAVLFSWPSRGDTLAYAYDQNSALGARDRFIELIKLLQSDAGIKRINILAHSMGNLIAIDSLASEARTANPARIGELIMAAPDIDQMHYQQAMKEISKIAAGMTLYASSADKAMVVSRGLAMAPRAGDLSGDQPVLVDGVDAIDVTAMGDEMFGLNHDTFAARRSLLNDIKLILKPGLRPPNDRLSEIRKMPEGASRALYWRYVQ